MELAAIPWASGSLIVLVLSVIASVATMMYKGLLVPRSHVEDVRADRDARIAQAEKDRDERIAEAERDAERGWTLYDKERESHEKTRRALLDQALGVTAPALAVAETAEKILTEFQQPGGADG